VLKLLACVLLLFAIASDAAAQKVRLTWNIPKGNNIHSYRIYRKASWQSNFQLAGETQHPDTVYVDKQLFFNVEILYAVTSVDSAGNESSFSRLADLFIPDSYAPFGEFAVETAEKEVTLNWLVRKNEREWEFQIFRSDGDRENFTPLQTVAFNPAMNGNRLQFVDRNLTSGHYFYYIVTKNRTGGEFFSEVKSAAVEIPKNFYLSQNFPNPFNSTTVVRFGVPEFTGVMVAIFNLQGQKVRDLVDENFQSGSYQIQWNGKDAQNADLASGTYFIRMTAGKSIFVKRILLLK